MQVCHARPAVLSAFVCPERNFEIALVTTVNLVKALTTHTHTPAHRSLTYPAKILQILSWFRCNNGLLFRPVCIL